MSAFQTSYNAIDEKESLKLKYNNDRKRLLYSFIALLSFTTYYVINSEINDDDTDICLTPECIELSQEILSYMDESYDPCNDFFSYSCHGFTKEYSYKLAQNGEHQYRALDKMADLQKDAFLEAIFTNKNGLNLNESSIRKVITFYDSCYSSNANKEEIEANILLNKFIENVNFTQNINMDLNINWTFIEIHRFQNALKWLSRRRWNLLFNLNTYSQQIPSIYQNGNIWIGFNVTFWKNMMDNVYKKEFELLFGLNETETNIISDEIIDFMNKIANISTIQKEPYNADTLSSMQFDEINDIFGASSILNYSQLIFNTFEIESISSEIEYIIYLQNGIDFFNDFRVLIESTPPITVQYFLYLSILSNKESLHQSNKIDRKQFCFELTKNGFNYIYAHILDKKMYGIAAQTEIDKISHYIMQKGAIPLIESAEWMDQESKNNVLLKAQSMRMYTGLPPKVRNISNLNLYYLNMTLNESNFVQNYEELIDFKQAQMLLRFKGNVETNLVSPQWPLALSHPERLIHGRYEDSWLTQITAFYNRQRIANENGNFFVMPWTISISPFFRMNYPSAMKFGAIGGVIGHEISHAFDPSGSGFNWNGTKVSIWTNSTLTNYAQKMDCFIKQYDNLSVNGIFLNGTNSITENCADNAGVQESYLAFTKYIEESNDYWDEVKLPGLQHLNNEKLYWIGFARTFCDIWTKKFYDDKITQPGYYWTHSPEKPRMVAVVQNTQAFADTFNCPVGSAMNPQNKCILW